MSRFEGERGGGWRGALSPVWLMAPEGGRKRNTMREGTITPLVCVRMYLVRLCPAPPRTPQVCTPRTNPSREVRSIEPVRRKSAREPRQGVGGGRAWVDACMQAVHACEWEGQWWWRFRTGSGVIVHRFGGGCVHVYVGRGGVGGRGGRASVRASISLRRPGRAKACNVISALRP